MSKQNIPIPSARNLCAILRFAPHTHIQVPMLFMDMESKGIIIKQNYLQKHIKQLSAVKPQSFQLLT